MIYVRWIALRKSPTRCEGILPKVNLSQQIGEDGVLVGLPGMQLSKYDLPICEHFGQSEAGFILVVDKIEYRVISFRRVG